MLTDYVLPDGRMVSLSDACHRAAETFQLASGSVVWALRDDLTGHQPDYLVSLLELLGQRSEPRFAVVVCSWCKSVLGLKTECNGTTHSICRDCVKVYRNQ